MDKQQLVSILEMILASLKQSIILEEGDLRPSLLKGGSGGISDDWQPNYEAIQLAQTRKLDVTYCAAKYRKWAKDKSISNADDRFLQWLRWEKQMENEEGSLADEPYVPSLEDWEAGAKRFARNQSQWGYHLGQEPGMIGCKCPQEILLKYGIDPQTGMRLHLQSSQQEL